MFAGGLGIICRILENKSCMHSEGGGLVGFVSINWVSRALPFSPPLDHSKSHTSEQKRSTSSNTSVNLIQHRGVSSYSLRK